VAVVGGGVAGLTAGYLLRTRYDVTLFESLSRLGGHADTHHVPAPDGAVHAIDTGFIVSNTRTYPLLTRLLGELGVATQRTEMSLSVRCDGCGLEYAGGRGIAGLAAGLTAGLAAGRGSAAGRRYVRMLAEAPRFYRGARAALASVQPGADQTLGQFLSASGFSAYFQQHFAAPLVATVWSCPPRLAFSYPARYLFTFLANHGMLSVRRPVTWHTISGGSASYVNRIAGKLGCVRVGSAVRSVRRVPAGVEVRDASGAAAEFDAAVIATHADQALSLLAEPTRLERELLGAFSYSRNRVLLHSDPLLLPRSRGARASWNYYQDSCSGDGPARVSYDMNRLQRLGTRHRYLVSVNPGAEPKAVAAAMTYSHPVYTPQSVRAQRRLAELNDGRLAFAGAYHGWGFHEDGCRSGVAAAASLGAAWLARRRSTNAGCATCGPRPSGTSSRTAPGCGWWISTRCPACRARPAGWPGSSRATTWATRRPPCGRTSRRFSRRTTSTPRAGAC
jgi:predicted NAD/FAD-binding protein